MRQYELTYIIRPDLDEDATASVAERVEQIIKANGGRVLKTDRWGKRRLAYSIQRYSEGYYLLLLTELNDVAIREIERHMKLSEDVIRHLLVRVEEEEAEAEEAEVEPAEAVQPEEAEVEPAEAVQPEEAEVEPAKAVQPEEAEVEPAEEARAEEAAGEAEAEKAEEEPAEPAEPEETA